MRKLVRFSTIPVGTTFKYNYVVYVKTLDVYRKDNPYDPNSIRLDNGKEARIHGMCQVEVIK